MKMSRASATAITRKGTVMSEQLKPEITEAPEIKTLRFERDTLRLLLLDGREWNEMPEKL